VTGSEEWEVGRAIDVPLEDLPTIDEHGLLVHAPREIVWKALLETVPKVFSRSTSTRVARALGCVETEHSGDPGRIGSTVPGFVVARVVEPAVLALEGQHRFSRYGLIFSLEPTKDERTLLRAETRADFPGVKGSVYRTLVIGTRGHVVVVKRLLGTVKKRAERDA
jgi:hypothetical protein